MTTFLLLISLLLNGVSIYFIIVLFTRQNRLAEAEKRPEKLLQEVEEIVSASLLEMKEENEAFIKQFKEIYNQASQAASPTPKTMKKKDNNQIGSVPFKEQLNQGWIEKPVNVSKKRVAKAYKDVASTIEKTDQSLTEEPTLLIGEMENAVESMVEPTTDSVENTANRTQEEIFRDLLLNQVQILQKQGLSSEKIAKKLGKGKTEIELLLKFGQTERNA